MPVKTETKESNMERKWFAAVRVPDETETEVKVLQFGTTPEHHDAVLVLTRDYLERQYDGEGQILDIYSERV